MPTEGSDLDVGWLSCPLGRWIFPPSLSETLKLQILKAGKSHGPSATGSMQIRQSRLVRVGPNPRALKAIRVCTPPNVLRVHVHRHPHPQTHMISSSRSPNRAEINADAQCSPPAPAARPNDPSNLTERCLADGRPALVRARLALPTLSCLARKPRLKPDPNTVGTSSVPLEPAPYPGTRVIRHPPLSTRTAYDGLAFCSNQKRLSQAVDQSPLCQHPHSHVCIVPTDEAVSE